MAELALNPGAAPFGEVAAGFAGPCSSWVLLHSEDLCLAAAACGAAMGFGVVAELAVISGAAPFSEVAASFAVAGSCPVWVLLHSGNLCLVAGLLSSAPCCWRRAEGEAEAIGLPRKLVLDVARDHSVVRNAKNSNGGLAVRALGLLLVTPAQHGEKAHFTKLRQDCFEGGGCQELRSSDAQADVGGGWAQHSVDHCLGEGVDGCGVLGRSGDRHDAAGLLVRCKVDEVKWPRESATQS